MRLPPATSSSSIWARPSAVRRPRRACLIGPRLDIVRSSGIPGDSPSGVLLAQVDEWDPPVPMDTVLSQIDPAENAKADFQAGVIRITAHEYETALAVAAGRAPPTS
jgi:hypothetical protein